MNKYIVDTNILLRVFINDGDPQKEATYRLLQDVDNGEIQLIVPNEVIIEACWVLKSYYGLDRSFIAKTIKNFLESDGIECSKEIYQAICSFEIMNSDIVDLLLASASTISGVPVLSWDKGYSKLSCEYYSPDEIASQ